MNLFYTKWLEGKPVREAFRSTQLKMAENYKAMPEKWAAFVLFE
jgi:CHAT domain-containing protein